MSNETVGGQCPGCMVVFSAIVHSEMHFGKTDCPVCHRQTSTDSLLQEIDLINYGSADLANDDVRSFMKILGNWQYRQKQEKAAGAG